MIFWLIFLLSWLSGMFVILLAAFFSYEYLNLIDITSFAVFLFIACLLIIPLLYVLVLKFIRRGVKDSRQFIYYPLSLLFLANLPVYFIIGWKTYDLYGWNEALLFLLGFFTIALVFGICMAWKHISMPMGRIKI